MFHRPLWNVVKKTLRIAGGVLCLILGILGGFIPVFQGWIFVALGCLLLSADVPFFRWIVRKAGKKFPRLKQHIDEWKKKFGKKNS